MSRRVGLLVLVVVLLLAAVVVGLALSARSPLQDGRDAVDGRWVPLRVPLAVRYDALLRPYGFILLYALLLTRGFDYLVVAPSRFILSWLV